MKSWDGGQCYVFMLRQRKLNVLSKRIRWISFHDCTPSDSRLHCQTHARRSTDKNEDGMRTSWMFFPVDSVINSTQQTDARVQDVTEGKFARVFNVLI